RICNPPTKGGRIGIVHLVVSRRAPADSRHRPDRLLFAAKLTRISRQFTPVPCVWFGGEALWECAMAALPRCPDPHELQQLLLGRLPEQVTETLELHVAQCESCARLLPTLPAEDTLVEAMRARSAEALQPADRSTIERLIPQLHQLRSGTTSISSARQMLS